VTAVGVDTTSYHHAGATETQDIAFALATGVVYLRAMEQQGLSIDAAAPQIQFRMSVDTDLFFAVAKLRAARWLWWQVVRACGGSPAAGAMRLEVRTSERVLTRRDPHLNLLRNLMGVMAAALGGSDIISSVPFDARVDLPDEFSRRLARNTLLILQHEAQLNRVIDAAGGSWYVERLTRQLAQHAWQLFQDIERRGGMMSALASGLISQQVETAAAARQASWVSRRPVIADDDGAARNDDPHTQRTEVNIDALRRAAMERLAARPSPPVSIPAAADRVKEAVAAATRGASIAQLASALGFQSDATTIAALRPDYRADWLEASPDSAAARNR
jgi:methylmalonyl-CoA mutase